MLTSRQEEGAVYVIARYRQKNADLRTQLERIIGHAGLKPKPKLFQNLRATRATELVAAGWPEYKVCAWIGHTEAIAKKHYWQVTDEDFTKAAGLDTKAPALQKSLSPCDVLPCNPMQANFSPLSQLPMLHDLASNNTTLQAIGNLIQYTRQDSNL